MNWTAGLLLEKRCWVLLLQTPARTVACLPGDTWPDPSRSFCSYEDNQKHGRHSRLGVLVWGSFQLTYETWCVNPPFQLLLEGCKLLLEFFHFSPPFIGLLYVSVKVSVDQRQKQHQLRMSVYAKPLNVNMNSQVVNITGFQHIQQWSKAHLSM